MNRKMAAIWMSLILLIGPILIIVEMAPTVEAPATLFVGGVGPGNYSTIQDAINAANPGDTVFVYNGTYYENLIVNQTITLIGENKNTTIINGGGTEDVIWVQSNWVTITDFSIVNSGPNPVDAGLFISSDYVNVTNNRITNNEKGIYINKSSNNNIIDSNNISNNGVHGINLMRSLNHNITNNIITSNLNGIILDDSKNHYNRIINNNVSGNTYYGISLWMSDNNTIIDNIISNNDEGIRGSSDFNLVKNNTISQNNLYGINLGGSSYNNILNNNISYNINDGIYHVGSHYSNITKNTISTNGGNGIYLSSSSNNRIFHNNIIDNTNQAYDDSSGNFWNTTYPYGGNYWNDYSGNDYYKGPNQDVPGSDGIGDSTYLNIAGGAGAVDYYPLMKLYPMVDTFLYLNQGWNLISIPLIQVEQNLTRVLGSIESLYDAVQWRDITDSSDPWKHNRVGKPYGNDLFKLNETLSFWIHIIQPGDTLFLYNGTQPTENQTITLHPGWNMVGYPSSSFYNRTIGLNNLTFGSEVDTIWYFDAPLQTWRKLEETDFFKPGRGYWIHATTQCEWEVPL